MLIGVTLIMVGIILVGTTLVGDLTISMLTIGVRRFTVMVMVTATRTTQIMDLIITTEEELPITREDEEM